MSKTVLKKISENSYISSQGLSIHREYGKTPNGNDMSGRWVLRDSKNNMIDFDQYRNDLADRNNLILIEM